MPLIVGPYFDISGSFLLHFLAIGERDNFLIRSCKLGYIYKRLAYYILKSFLVYYSTAGVVKQLDICALENTVQL